jgi:methenyltetrahydrofolate cyclohydrolase
VTGACVAMMAARTCVLGALLNVRINLTSIKDETFVRRMSNKADFLESEAIRIEKKLLDWEREQLTIKMNYELCVNHNS